MKTEARAGRALSSLRRERRAHFARLGEAPEQVLELMLSCATAHRLEWRGRPAGYWLCACDGTSLELGLQRAVWPQRELLFAATCGELGLSVFCTISAALAAVHAGLRSKDARVRSSREAEEGPASASAAAGALFQTAATSRLEGRPSACASLRGSQARGRSGPGD